MRGIKFRAWDIDNRKIVKIKSLNLMSATSDYSVVIEPMTFIASEHLELMQYTGLKDKNGVEIYEGDVVHFNHNQMSGLGFVYWNNELGQWWIKDIREATKKRGQRYYPFWKDCKYRVDGNIYENPELLETKKSS